MNSRQCALCETLRPEAKMIRQGRVWVCVNRKVCDKGVRVRDKAAETDAHVFGWRKDHWGRP